MLSASTVVVSFDLPSPAWRRIVGEVAKRGRPDHREGFDHQRQVGSLIISGENTWEMQSRQLRRCADAFTDWKRAPPCRAKDPSRALLAYATTKGAIANFTVGLAQLVAKDGIRVNAVAPGPIWTPLIPSTMTEEAVKNFGKNTPLGRAGQPAELAPAYVLLASDEASYISGALVPVTGGRPML